MADCGIVGDVYSAVNGYILIVCLSILYVKYQLQISPAFIVDGNVVGES
jgi:hypothetical protein